MMKAVIFAGGKGERLWPLTGVKPKPLLPVANRPMLSRVMDNINKVTGIREFVVITNYKCESVEEYCNGMSCYDIETVREKKFLGTAGGLRLLDGLVDGDFIVWNSDTFAFFDTKRLIASHAKRKALATVCTTQNIVKSSFGETRIGKGSRLVEFVEKPCFGHVVNIGIYLLNPGIIDNIKSGEAIGMDELLRRTISNVYCHDINGLWVDVGNFSTFIYANNLFLKEFDLRSDDSSLPASCRINNYAIGKGVSIGEGSLVSDSSVDEGVSIGKGTKIEASVIFPNARIGDRCEIRNSIIGYNATVSDGTCMNQSIVSGT